ncbi:hypothetical protein B0H19DRAFT_1332481, partial [Mycena capillaripes]
LQYFLPHAVQFGFFLHLDRFRDAALIPQLLFGDILRPSRSLLFAAYLWGAHLSQTSPLFDLKPVLLRRALQSLSTEIYVHTDAVHALQTLQAHVLLAQYFLLQGRFLAAQLQANAAATLALGWRLHKLGSAPPPTTSPIILHGEIPPFDAYLTPSQDSVEEGERVRAFWAVVSLQVSLTLASSGGVGMSTSSSCLLEAVGAEVDTPWPMQSVEYELQDGYSAADNYGGEVIRRFLGNESSNIPIPVCYAQAARLPPMYPSADPDLVLTHTLVAAASIRLHRPFVPSSAAAQTKCLAAARAVVQFLGDTTSPHLVQHANPLIGTVGALACGVLIDEIHGTREMWSEWAETLDIPVALPAGEEESMLLLNLQEGMMIMGGTRRGVR